MSRIKFNQKIENNKLILKQENILWSMDKISSKTIGKWSLVCKQYDIDFIYQICKKAILDNIVNEIETNCLKTNLEDKKVINFCVDLQDGLKHKKIIQFLIDNNLIDLENKNLKNEIVFILDKQEKQKIFKPFFTIENVLNLDKKQFYDIDIILKNSSKARFDATCEFCFKNY